MIVAVELRQWSGVEAYIWLYCTLGMHDLSLGVQRTFFYIMYIKPRYSFAFFSLPSLALAVGKKKNHVKFLGVRSPMESRSEKYVMKKEYARSERSSLYLSRTDSPPHLPTLLYLPTLLR